MIFLIQQQKHISLASALHMTKKKKKKSITNRINRFRTSKVDGFGRATEKKAMIVRRTTLVPDGHRFGDPGHGRVEFRRGVDQADGS